MKKVNFRRVALFAINIGVILLMFFMLFRAVPAVLGAETIVLDGLFTDWNGQSCISDPTGDVADPKKDITLFCFATNPGVENTYFMAERASGNTEITYTLFIDTNNNGIFNDSTDKIVTIQFKPTGQKSRVIVEWPGGQASGDWGESKSQGAERAEWYVPFAALGISPGQPIQMYLASSQDIDTTAIVQWSPANALGWILLGVILVGASVWMTFLSSKAAKSAPRTAPGV
jgi:hypothetical protein